VTTDEEPPAPGRVPLSKLREWAGSDDPLLRNLAFHTAYEHPATVDGLAPPERESICLRFLEDGLAGRFGNSIPDGPYVLAHTLAAWLRSETASSDPAPRATVAAIVSMLERLARAGDAATREVILLGLLEHVVDEDATREPFEGWRDDPELGPLLAEAERLGS